MGSERVPGAWSEDTKPSCQNGYWEAYRWLHIYLFPDRKWFHSTYSFSWYTWGMQIFHMFDAAGNWVASDLSSMPQFAVDLLMEVYKQTFNKMGGYIVNTEKVSAESNSYFHLQLVVELNVDAPSVATENSWKKSMLDILKSQGWKSIFKNCPCMKRKISSKDMSCERYAIKLIIMLSKYH